MTDTPFVHLHCHTDYSLLDGACEIEQLMEVVAEQKMPAVAMTDHGNLFGAVKFYNAANAKGIHPVIGCEVYVSQQGHKTRSDTDRYNHLVLLCENQDGYRNLIDLVSTAYLDGFYYKPRIDKDLLNAKVEGAYRSLGLPSRRYQRNPHRRPLCTRAKSSLTSTRDLFGKDNFFLEIQDHRPGSGQSGHAPIGPHVGRYPAYPLVATNDSHYLRKEDARAHEILMCIQTGKTMSDPNRMRFTHPEFYHQNASLR